VVAVEGAEQSRQSKRLKRWAVGMGVAMWACGFFVARVPGATRPELSGASALFVVAFALPSYAVLWRWAQARRAAQVLAALGLFALGIESLAVATGWPYGQFSYGEAIGGKVAGLVPWSVPFAWTPLVLGTHALAERLLASLSRARAHKIGSQVLGVLVATLALAAADLVLDPGAVHQKFWSYPEGGLYYHVPASNYFGWLLSGLAGHALLRWLLRPDVRPGAGKPAISKQDAPGAPATPDEPNPERAPGVPLRLGAPPAGLAVSLGWTLAFWCSVCLWAGLWAPALIGHVALAGLWLALRPRRSQEAPPSEFR